ncbi:hypothetical protein A3A66_04645 [Microgenomates group bacterium RIFCSPLOWO2_01_FULL_46_13]|nr:MAG: hypothetical protein A2783_05120 [Microgenomates group bacterium RIFCSPHIGHO2_01_FULL_45_11]OGV94257.1 MAG: hypothetical protein A3A66_04645 [Microgenomates group bacterium RIFCSPLOWO2_01_FULL_46_13]
MSNLTGLIPERFQSSIKENSDNPLYTLGAAFLIKINHQRQEHGLSPFQLNPLLIIEASLRSLEMVSGLQPLGHQLNDGTQALTRIPPEEKILGIFGQYQKGECIFTRSDQDPGRLDMTDENNIAEVIAAWLASASHRPELLDPLNQEAGVGVAQWGDAIVVNLLTQGWSDLLPKLIPAGSEA